MDRELILTNIYSTDETLILDAVRTIRQLLSAEHNPPIAEIIEMGIVPRLLYLVQNTDSEIQYEAAWGLTNIASGTKDQTMCLVDNECLPIFLNLLNSPQKRLCEQILWAIGNIAGDSPQLRNLVLQNGAPTHLTNLVKRFPDGLSLLRNAAWTMSNFARGKPPPPPEYALQYLDIAKQLLMIQDRDIQVDSIWTFSFLTDTSDEVVRAIINSGVMPHIMKNLDSDVVQLLVPSLRACGNILSGDDTQTQYLINLGLISKLAILIQHSKTSIRKEAIWSVSNICSGNVAQIQSIVESHVLEVLSSRLLGESMDVAKEIMWCITNTTSGGNLLHINYLVEKCDVVSNLISVLTKSSLTSLHELALEACANLLLKDTNTQDYFKMLVEQGFIEEIIPEFLASSPEEIEKFLKHFKAKTARAEYYRKYFDQLLEKLESGETVDLLSHLTLKPQ